MSHVTITCPCCEITGRVRKKYAGRNVTCRQCAHSFRMPPRGDCVEKLLRRTANTVVIPLKVKSVTRVKAGKKDALRDMRNLILLREEGVITASEFNRLRHSVGGR